MYVTHTTLIVAASVISAIIAIITLVYKIFKWFDKQEQQSVDIRDIKEQQKKDLDELEQKHENEKAAMEDELCLLTYAILACLKGLKEQGCNGPVTEAIQKVEKHLNQRAHGQEERA